MLFLKVVLGVILFRSIASFDRTLEDNTLLLLSKGDEMTVEEDDALLLLFEDDTLIALEEDKQPL